jgi:LPPG:FO 2-phospho-L-lactate transferase
MSVAILTGGVGGAKLVLGLSHAVEPGSVTAIVNTGDDFEHLGLRITPDIDTLLYTLAGKSDEVRGWGRAGETWAFMAALRSLGGEDWFQLGDGDLAVHVERTRRLRAGERLSAIISDFARSWGLRQTILPMSDDEVCTWIDTDEGALPFQRYFVERRCAPRAIAIRYEGAGAARPAPGVAEAIANAKTILIAPSNPYLSVDPILAVPEIYAALEQTRAPVIAVSPLVGGQAVKGPTRKLMDELGVAASPQTIAAHYHPLLDAILLDERDRESAPPPIAHAFADTLMHTLEDRVRVARASLDLAASLS